MPNQHLDEFYKKSNDLADIITAREAELVQILSEYETQDAAKDEIERSVSTLRGFKDEFEAIKNPLSGLNVSTFFPLNLPLYSLVLFGIAPSAFSSNVFIRPPEVMHSILTKVWEFLQIDTHFSNVSLKPTPRHIFMELYASESDVIMFTGKYENAVTIHNQCPQALMVYNGSGVNPFLLFEDADVELAAAKAVEMRCFNSGQDCAGPDAFFVPATLADRFIEKLKENLKNIKVGTTSDPETRIGKTMKESYILEIQELLKTQEKWLVTDVDIDLKNHLVRPSILRKNVNDHEGEFHEFFAPYFYVLEYNNDSDLERVLSIDSFQKRGMYISVFGNNPAIEEKLTFVRLLKNVIVNDVEQGNTAYGGYGSEANFLLFAGQKIVKPVLISRDVHEMLSEQAA